MKQLECIEISCNLVGLGWWNQPISMSVKKSFTPIEGRFTYKWEGLDSALKQIMNQGDFQLCKVKPYSLSVKTYFSVPDSTKMIVFNKWYDNIPKFLQGYILPDKYAYIIEALQEECPF